MTDAARLTAFVRGAAKLPVLPQITVRLLKTVDAADSSANDIAEVIQAEPSLAVRFLKLANSSFFGQRGQIATIPNAVVVLGSKTIRSLALAVWTHTLRAGSRDALTTMLMAPLLAHGLSTGVAAGMLAERIHPERGDDAFMAGLLHDIGRVALVAQLGSDYRARILEPAQNQGLPLHEQELAMLGFDHRGLGANLMASWALPPFLAEVAEHHHDIGIDPRQQFFVAAVALADVLSTRLGSNLAVAAPRAPRDEIAAHFRLQREEDLAEFLELCAGRFRALSEALA